MQGLFGKAFQKTFCYSMRFPVEVVVDLRSDDDWHLKIFEHLQHPDRGRPDSNTFLDLFSVVMGERVDDD